VDDLEAAEYHRIAQGRLEIIKRFEDLLDDDEKERIIQEHLFEHLWLLDPSWERGGFLGPSYGEAGREDIPRWQRVSHRR
jgi:hypothetical protein